MKKLSKSRLFAMLVTAIFILNQAVFLFVPFNINAAQAQTPSDISLAFFDLPPSPISGTVTIKVNISATMAVSEVYLSWPCRASHHIFK